MKIPMERPGARIALASVALFLFTLLLLTIGYGDYLRRLEGLSIFLPGSMFWSECMHQPGGALQWAGCYLTQYFYHPILGATIYSVMVAGAYLLTIASFRLKDSLYGIASLPAAMMLLWLLQPGYVIFSLRTTGYAYFGILGMIAALSIYLGYSYTNRRWLRALVMLVVIVAGYPLLGVFALTATLLCVIYELKRGGIGGCILGASGVAATVVYPHLYFIYRPTILTHAQIYIAGMPNIMPEETILWLPYVVALASLIVFAIIGGRKWKLKHAAAVNYCMLASVMASVMVCRYNDSNFMVSLRLAQAIEDGDWQKAADTAREIDFEPTRLNNLYTYIALMRLGKAEEAMFTYPAGSARYDSPRESNAMRDAAGTLVSYHFGRTYNAYRWAMEYKVEYGLKVEYLKYLAKCALLNGEYDLARKYLNTLSKTKYHGEWASRYMEMANNPALMLEDEEMKQIIPLRLFKDHLGGDGGKIETYLMAVTSALGGGTPELQNLSLICNLIMKDVDLFMKKYGNAAMKLKHIPRHYQEAILVWSMIHQTPAYRQFNIDPYVMQRFDQFMRANKMALEMPNDDTKEKMKATFGDTYWYYYFFADELKTNQ